MTIVLFLLAMIALLLFSVYALIRFTLEYFALQKEYKILSGQKTLSDKS